MARDPEWILRYILFTYDCVRSATIVFWRHHLRLPRGRTRSCSMFGANAQCQFIRGSQIHEPHTHPAPIVNVYGICFVNRAKREANDDERNGLERPAAVGVTMHA